jgi:hypothetical protein
MRASLFVAVLGGVSATLFGGTARAQQATSAPVTVVVHVASARAVRLEREVPGEEWESVCASPCDREVAVLGNYRIRGDWVRASTPFTLKANEAHRNVIDVEPASKAGFAGGIVLASLGAAAALAGTYVTVLGSGGDIEASARPIGTGLLIGGLVGVATGLVLVLLNAHTEANVSDSTF